MNGTLCTLTTKERMTMNIFEVRFCNYGCMVWLVQAETEQIAREMICKHYFHNVKDNDIATLSELLDVYPVELKPGIFYEYDGMR